MITILQNRTGIRVIIIMLIFWNCYFPTYSQSKFKYRKVENKTISSTLNYKAIDSIQNGRFKNAKKATSFLPRNYSKKGNVDYTNFLQNAINESEKLIMPNFPVLINYKGLKLKTNSEILFQTNSKLIIKSNDKESYYGLYVEDASNIRIFFPKIEGDKYSHIGQSGQWGMGISLRNSNNIFIFHPHITRCWGDGIYIGEKNNLPCSYIQIIGGYIDDNRRNGISIISGRNISIQNSFISNTNGVSPGYGIDIEPNNNNNILDNIDISNVTTFNNTAGGILFALDNLNGADKKYINIKILNHKDYYSPTGMEFAIDRNYVKQKNNNISGTIFIENCIYISNQAAIKNNYSKINSIEYLFKDIYINNKKISDLQLINYNIKRGQKFSINK